MLLALLLQFVHFDVVLGQNRATTLIVLLVSELLDLRLCFFGVKKFAFHDTLFAIQLHFDSGKEKYGVAMAQPYNTD